RYPAPDPAGRYPTSDPTDRYHRPGAGYGTTPSRRRAVERGQRAPADGYLPSWASGADTAGRAAGPGSSRADGVDGRPRATDRAADRATDRAGSAPEAGWWQRHGPDWADSDPTEEAPGWFDKGSTRLTAETTDGWQNVSGTTGWGGPSTAPGGRRADHTAEWRIAARHAGHLPSSGEAEPGSSTSDGWEAPTPVDWQDRTSGDGRWDRHPDTGPWRDGTGPAGRYDDSDGRLVPWSDRTDTFWSGTRLAGDDPRWMATPASAPRSPVVSWPLPEEPPAPEAVSGVPGRAGPVVAPERSTRPGPRPASGSSGGGRRGTPEPSDEEPTGGVLAAVLYTVACYLLPVVLLVGWLFTLDARVPTGCVTDVTGGGCASPRAFAVESMLGGAQQFGLALLTSLLTAVVLRWLSTGWRAGSVGLAAAVVGGGISTLLYSAISGQPLG
ncbi:hypothetical protein, partial [Micromonospora echinofusca]